MAKNKSSKSKSNSRLSQTRKPTKSPKKKKESIEQLDNDHSAKKEEIFKTTCRPAITKNQRKEDLSNKNVLTIKYESEVERALRLKMFKVKTKYHKELTKSSNSTLSAESSSRQRLSNQKASNATSNPNCNSLSQSNLKDAEFPMKGVKVPKPYVSNNMLSSDKTGYIWKFEDGSTAKKVY